MSPHCHLTLNLDSSSEGKKGVLTLKTATEGGAVSELVWCPEYEGVFGASFYPPTMEKHHMTPEPWRRLNGEDRKTVVVGLIPQKQAGVQETKLRWV